MATFSNIGIEESSTLTGKVATIVIQRGSSNEHQEILCVGDPNTSNAIAVVGNSAPAGNAFGLGVRLVGGPSSAVDVTIRALLSSTNTDNPVRAILSSTNTDNPVRAILSSTSSDNPFQINTVLDSSNAAVKVADSANNALRMRLVASDLAGSTTVSVANCQSSVAPSSNSSAFTVRQVIDNILTTASTNGFAASTSFTIQSSGAALRSYVTAYSILSTNAGPHRIKFYSSGTMVWPVIFAAASSVVSGANLAVSAPAYLFRTSASEALSLRLGSGASTIAGYQIAVSYFIAP